MSIILRLFYVTEYLADYDLYHFDTTKLIFPLEAKTWNIPFNQNKTKKIGK